MSKKMIFVSLFSACIMSGNVISMDLTQVANIEMEQLRNSSAFAGKIEHIHKTKSGLLYVFYENEDHQKFSYSIINTNTRVRLDLNNWIPGSFFNIKMSQADISKYITTGPNDELYIPVATSASTTGKYGFKIYKLTPEMSANSISEVYQKDGDLPLRGLNNFVFNHDFSKIFMGISTDRENAIIVAFNLNEIVEKPEDAEIWRHEKAKVKLTHAIYDVHHDALITTQESSVNAMQSFDVHTLNPYSGKNLTNAKMIDLDNSFLEGRLLSIEPKNEDAADSRYVLLDNCKLGLWHRFTGDYEYRATGYWKEAPGCTGTSVWKLAFNNFYSEKVFINYSNAIYVYDKFNGDSVEDTPLLTIYPPKNSTFQSNIAFDDKGNGYLNYWNDKTRKGGFVKFSSSGEKEYVTVKNMTSASAKIAPVTINGTVYSASSNSLYEYREDKPVAIISGDDTITGSSRLLLSAEKSILPDGPVTSETLFSWSALGDNADKVKFSNTEGMSTFLLATDGSFPSFFDVEIELTVTDPKTGQSSSVTKTVSYHPVTDSEGDMEIDIQGADKLVRAGMWYPTLPKGTLLDDVYIEWMVDGKYVDRSTGIDLNNGISGSVSGRPLALSLIAPRNLTAPNLILKVFVTDKKNGKKSSAEKIVEVGK
ncbi:hypothetical protein OQ483_24315 (plasmid) [Enterobacter bugandensis]|uniref:hypothetical protein n=1 Tax=Enterobacter bugandensis TaxID=881260 RepID=UPI00283AA01F|nr:hypothetical protein [Enterobacter bugandensis]WMU75490.1 hypothetical protein OQ483_24315 [Enterobacter bugandensis]